MLQPHPLLSWQVAATQLEEPRLLEYSQISSEQFHSFPVNVLRLYNIKTLPAAWLVNMRQDQPLAGHLLGGACYHSIQLVRGHTEEAGASGEASESGI